MQTRHVGKFVLITALFIACFGFMILPPARGLSFSVTAVYTGGDVQKVFVTATAAGAGYTPKTWTLYYQNDTLVPGTTDVTGDLDDMGGGVYTKNISVMKFDAGNYYVSVFLNNGGDSGFQNATFTIRHDFRFTGKVGEYYLPETDVLTITSVPFCTTQDVDGDGLQNDLVPESFITSKKYIIYDAGGAAVRTDDLDFKSGNWMKELIPVKWMNGNFTVGAKFVVTNGTTFETTPADRSPFTRNNATEWYIILISIIGGAAAAIFISIAYFNKRNASRDLVKKKEKKDKKEIKVLEISKEDIKKAKGGKVPPPKEEGKEEVKGVTKKSGDLIFEVPKWEEGDADK